MYPYGKRQAQEGSIWLRSPCPDTIHTLIDLCYPLLPSSRWERTRVWWEFLDLSIPEVQCLGLGRGMNYLSNLLGGWVSLSFLSGNISIRMLPVPCKANRKLSQR